MIIIIEEKNGRTEEGAESSSYASISPCPLSPEASLCVPSVEEPIRFRPPDVSGSIERTVSVSIFTASLAMCIFLRPAQYGSPPTPAKFCRMMHAAAELDDGKHEARRAVIVAEQLWPQEWKGEGRSSHPVLGHPQLKGLLREKGVFDGIGRL